MPAPRCRCRPQADPADRDPVTLPGGAGNVGRGEGLRRGVGFALGFKNIGYSEGFDDFHQARVTLSRGPDGPIAEVRTAAVEVGQGLGAVMTQVVRTELGVEHVVLHTADTELESAGSTSASRQTLMASGALQLACLGVLEELGRRAGAPLGRRDHRPSRTAASRSTGRRRRRPGGPAGGARGGDPHVPPPADDADGREGAGRPPPDVLVRRDACGGGRRPRTSALVRVVHLDLGRRRGHGDQPAARRGAERGRRGDGARASR